jgi:hypothetical protein
MINFFQYAPIGFAKCFPSTVVKLGIDIFSISFFQASTDADRMEYMDTSFYISTRGNARGFIQIG